MLISALLSVPLAIAALPGDVTDCNDNGLDDAVEISKGLVADCQGNGVIDDCERGGIEPLAYWRFEEPGGTTTADAGSLGLDGVTTDTSSISNVPFGSLPQSGADNLLARRIGGSGSIIVEDPGGDLTFGGADFTIEAWVRLSQLSNDDGPNQRQTLVQKKTLTGVGRTTDYLVLAQTGDATANNVGYRYGKVDGVNGRELAVLFGTGDDSPNTWIATSFLRITDNEWHHISVSLDSARERVRFTLDDQVDEVRIGSDDYTTNDGPLLIGAHTNGQGVFNQFLRGDIDELRICRGVIPTELLLANPRGGDCNENGLPDGCDIADGRSTDCDGDGRPDSCQIADNDCNGNGVPDQCDPDCNENGTPDECDIAFATSLDCQDDGIPDECQIEQGFVIRDDVSGAGFIAVRTDVPYMVWLQRFNSPANGTIVDAVQVDFGIAEPGIPVTACIWSDGNGDGDPADAQLLWSLEGAIPSEDGLIRIDVPGGIGVGDRGTSFFVGFSMEVDIDPQTGNFPAAYDIFGEPAPGRSWLIGSVDPIDLNDLRTFSEEYDLVERRYMTGNWVIRAITRQPKLDCNGNGTPDECDIEEGTSPDLDGDGRPDECGDCNGNGILDGFEIADGTLGDCDADAIPDICQSAGNDCDADGVPDLCQLESGGDCNGNGILDACDIASFYAADIDGSGVPDSCEDCNGNGQVDLLDVEFGETADCNDNLIPDECEFGDPEADRLYESSDGGADTYINLIGGTDFAWITQHVVEPGAEWIAAIDINWGLAWPGQEAKVAVWSDPNGDGDPVDAELLRAVVTTPIDVFGSRMVRVKMPPTRIGDAGDSFFIGAWYRSPIGGSPIVVDIDPPLTGRSWLVSGAAGAPTDLENMELNLYFDFSNYDFLMTAVAHDGTTFPGDCNVNTALDACDILDGVSDDLDGDGVPDDCATACAADFDGDGDVDGGDLGSFFVQWGECADDCDADFNGDGTVDGVDLGVMLQSWGICIP